MPYDQFAPCDVEGCPNRRAKRRRWCPEHAAWVDGAKDENRCARSTRTRDGVERCFRGLGHDGPCLARLDVLRAVMGSVDYLDDEDDQ